MKISVFFFDKNILSGTKKKTHIFGHIDASDRDSVTGETKPVRFFRNLLDPVRTCYLMLYSPRDVQGTGGCSGTTL